MNIVLLQHKPYHKPRMHGRWHTLNALKHLGGVDKSGFYRSHSQMVNRRVITSLQMISMIKSCKDVVSVFRLLSEHGHLLQAMHVACVIVTVSKLIKGRLNNTQKSILDSHISRVASFMNLQERQDTLDGYLKLGFEGNSKEMRDLLQL